MKTSKHFKKVVVLIVAAAICFFAVELYTSGKNGTQESDVGERVLFVGESDQWKAEYVYLTADKGELRITYLPGFSALTKAESIGVRYKVGTVNGAPTLMREPEEEFRESLLEGFFRITVYGKPEMVVEPTVSITVDGQETALILKAVSDPASAP